MNETNKYTLKHTLCEEVFKPVFYIILSVKSYYKNIMYDMEVKNILGIITNQEYKERKDSIWTDVEKYYHSLYTEKLENLGLTTNRNSFEKIMAFDDEEIKEMCSTLYEDLGSFFIDRIITEDNKEIYESIKKLEKISKEEDEENFYKKLSLACIETENKNLILEENDKIHYLILTDEAKSETNQGKNITIANYKEFLDPDFEGMNDENFTSWESLFDEHINNQIYYDMKDLGIYDENGDWDFYISKEDLKILGYENLENESEEEEDER